MSTVNPDEAVAYGAGIVAANLSNMGDEAMQFLELIDVTPLSLGVKMYRDVRHLLIPRNSRIPTNKEMEGYNRQSTFHIDKDLKHTF